MTLPPCVKLNQCFCFGILAALLGRCFFPWYEVHLFKHGALLPAGALEDALAVFAHAGMPAEVPRRRLRPQTPLIDVLSDQIIDAPRLAFAGGVLPGATDRCDELKPRHLRRDSFQLITIAEFPRTASTLQTIQLMVPRQRVIARFPVAVQRAGIADKGCYARHR